MKIEKLQTIFSDQKIIICMILVIFMFSLMSGCVTEKVGRWAEIKEKDTIKFIKIKNVRAATKQENGDILLCVEFADLGDSKESGYYTILLPISSLTNSDIGKTTHGFKKKSDVIDMLPRNESYYYHPYGWNWYLYPIEMAQKGCDKNFSEIFSIAQSPFPIEKINITHAYPQFSPSAESHEEFVNKLSQNETIYAARIFSAEQGTEIASDNPELTNEKANEAIKIHLIYWPSKLKQELEGIKPTGIAGGYQINKEGTNLGYLLILPAALIDFTASAIAVGVYGLLYIPMHMTGK